MSDDTESVNQEVNVAIEQRDSSPSILVRAIWFLFVGWWATGIWLGIAWFLNVTVIGMPIGIKMINYVPKVVSLKGRTVENDVISEGGEVTIEQSNSAQRSLLVRAVWFLLVGWWASGIWMGLAYLATLTVVGLPVAIWMYGKLPLVVSLYRY